MIFQDLGNMVFRTVSKELIKVFDLEKADNQSIFNDVLV